MVQRARRAIVVVCRRRRPVGDELSYLLRLRLRLYRRLFLHWNLFLHRRLLRYGRLLDRGFSRRGGFGFGGRLDRCGLLHAFRHEFVHDLPADRLDVRTPADLAGTSSDFLVDAGVLHDPVAQPLARRTERSSVHVAEFAAASVEFGIHDVVQGRLRSFGTGCNRLRGRRLDNGLDGIPLHRGSRVRRHRSRNAFDGTVRLRTALRRRERRVRQSGRRLAFRTHLEHVADLPVRPLGIERATVLETRLRGAVQIRVVAGLALACHERHVEQLVQFAAAENGDLVVGIVASVVGEGHRLRPRTAQKAHESVARDDALQVDRVFVVSGFPNVLKADRMLSGLDRRRGAVGHVHHRPRRLPVSGTDGAGEIETPVHPVVVRPVRRGLEYREIRIRIVALGRVPHGGDVRQARHQ